MSGKKEVTIDSSEYQRLRQHERQLRSIRADLPEQIESTLRENAAQLQRSLEPLERRQREYEGALSQVHSEVRDLEIDMAQRLAEQDRQMRHELNAVENRLRAETLSLIEEQERRLTNLVAEERRTRELQVGNLQSQIDTIVDDQQRKDEMASTWIETAQVLHDFIDGNYRHQQFAPGKLEKLERDIQQAIQNAEQSTPEAAMTFAQNAYHSLSDLRLELEQLEREWHIWHSVAQQSAQEILTEAQNNRQIEALDLEGKGTNIEVEADYWTNGKLSELQGEIEEIVSQISGEDVQHSTDELREIAEKAVPQFRQRIEQILEEARLAVIGSQLRVNIADLAVQALEDQGFVLQDGTYEGEDMRGGYVAKVNHRDGSEVVVTVTPDETQLGRNRMDIHSFDEQIHSEHERMQRARELASSMKDRGLQVSEPQIGADQGDPSVRDLEVVKKQKPQIKSLPTIESTSTRSSQIR